MKYIVVCIRAVNIHAQENELRNLSDCTFRWFISYLINFAQDPVEKTLNGLSWLNRIKGIA